jgi:hypothetical protein
LEESLESQKKTISKLEALLTNDLADVGSVVQQLQDTRQHVSKMEQGLHRKRTSLGVSEQADLVKLKESSFLRLRMNALALKQRIRDRLRQRKFEIEKFERTYRHGTNRKYILTLHCSISHVNNKPDAKLHGHAETSWKRRDPTIIKLAKDYNGICRQLAVLIQQKKAPVGAVQPQEITREGLFRLDVDDDVWQDVGLDEDNNGIVPLWLCDEGVRQGIRNLLELDRCKEEELRLMRERRALQEWLLEEWEVNERAWDAAGVLQILSINFPVF